LDFLKETARELQGQFSTLLRETTDRAAAELSAETVRFSDRQLALLAEQAQVAIGKVRHSWTLRPPKRVRSLKLRPIQCWVTFIRKPVSKLTKRYQSPAELQILAASFTDEIRANWEARQRACEDAVARSSENQAEQFRQRLEAILRSSMVHAISAVNEHSSALLNSLSEETEEQLKEATHRPASS